MPKNCSRCCILPREEEFFCCDPLFFTDFLTLFGDNLAEHAIVSPKDWVALYQPRPGITTKEALMIAQIGGQGGCLCCCETETCPPTGVVQGVTEFDPNNPITAEEKIFFNSTELGTRSDVYYKGNEDLNAPITQQQTNSGGLTPVDAGNEVDPVGCNNHITNDPIENARCQCGCCSRYKEKSIVDSASPIIFAYKYSGCKITWHPREYSFSYSPYVSQCNGWLSVISGVGNRQVSCHPFYAQPDGRGGSYDDVPFECTYTAAFLNVYNGPFTPCGCVPFPHLHGGPYDSIYNRVNVSLKPRQLGYVPFMAAFPTPMLVGEKGCCWCANAGAGQGSWEPFIKNRRSIFLATYPFFDQSGKYPGRPGASSGLPGTQCYSEAGPALNPSYDRYCFARGISPYLLRKSAKSHRMAFEIWGHGALESSRYFLGPSYEATTVNINRLNRDIEINFKKIYNKKTRLRDQYIGMINLEHHFECFAYRSDDGSSSVELQAVQNHCSMLIPGFESYGGRITGSGAGISRWTPWRYDSIKWQARRGIPRRAIYAGSSVPIFGFDLVKMEEIAEKNNLIGPQNGFDGREFLKHFFRYFHSLIYFQQGECESPGDIPGPPEWTFDHLLNSYEYVTYWVTEMIRYKIIRIKDHAIDIAEEVNDIISQGEYDSEGNLFISDDVAEEVGGIVEYQKILDLFGVTAGSNNLKPIDIKNKLLNNEGLESGKLPDGSIQSMNVFLPRRAILPNFDGMPGITGWLEASSGYLSYPNYEEFGFTGAQYSSNQTDVPYFYNLTDENNIFNQVLSPQKVVSGLGGTFIIDASGKITPFGAIVEQEIPNCPPQNSPQFPSGIGCVPWYFRVTELFEGNFPYNETDPSDGLEVRESGNIPDGRVIDLAFKGKNFVVALADFEYGGIGSNCIQQEQGQNYDATPATESNEFDFNINGSNESIAGRCLPYEPFRDGNFFNGGFLRPFEQKPGNAYRLKSWGSKAFDYGTFSLSERQYARIVEGLNEQYASRTYTGQNRRYPGTNAWFIWTHVGAGMEHFAALDDFGGVFIPPNCSNGFNQSQKGIGVEDIISDDARFIWGSLHEGFGADFNYFPHIPRPGYVKEEEWTQEFYNNITLRDTCYKKYACACHYESVGITNGACDRGGEFGNDNTPPICSNCEPTIFCNTGTGGVIVEEGLCDTQCRLYDKTCVLMGKLVRYASDIPTENAELIDNDARPKYTNLDCGHYNTLLLTNENRLEIYGKFVKINDEGNVIEGQPVIDAFIPEQLLSKAGTWGLTYACNKIYCDGATHSPLLEAEYFAPAPENIFTQIKSSADYCLAVTQDNKIHIWGDKAMLPNQFDPETYSIGQTGYTTIDLDDVVSINSIALGVHSFYISYKSRIGNSISSRVYSYTRYNLAIGTNFPLNLQNSKIVDISAGYIHGIVIYANRQRALGWDPNAFAKLQSGDVNVDTLKYQFKNFSSLPLYFRRQAFFHANPGYWDYSKWLWGGLGCRAFTEINEFQREDNCSALAHNIYKDPSDPTYFDRNLAKSGNPHYIWMRQDWRRSTAQSLAETIDNGGGGGTTPEEKCSPDASLAAIGGDNSFASVGNKFGTCFGNGPCWGYGRPMANVHRRVIKTPFGERCIKIPCTNPPVYKYVNRTICPIVPYTFDGIDIPPVNSYRSTKDVFQVLWSFFNYRKPGNCPGLSQQFWNYFKYAERHYYYGYDSDDGAWKVYDNPDFLGNINPLTVEPCPPIQGENWDITEPVIPTGANFCNIVCNPCGFGGGFTFGYSGYTGLGFTGSSLKNYPRSGPYYARESDVELPAWNLSSSGTIEVQATICGIINSLPEPLPGSPPSQYDTPCTICWSQPDVGKATYSYGGPGAFIWWGYKCGSMLDWNDVNGNPRPSSLQQNNMYSSYVYNRTVRRTLSASQLLFGVSDGLKPDIDPRDDPDYNNNKKSFINVLKDPNYTRTRRPWLFGGSDKWIPLCWTTPFILPTGMSNEGIYIPPTFYFNQSNNSLELSQADPSSFTFTLIPAEAEDGGIRCVGPIIQELPSFTLSPTNFENLTVKSGSFEFKIQTSITRESNNSKLYAKMYKLKSNGEEEFIIESDLSDVIVQNGTFGEGGIFPPIGNVRWNTSFFLHVLDDVSFNSDEYILFKLFIKYTNCDFQQTDFEMYFGLQQTPGVSDSKVLYTKYSIADENGNNPCFGGVSTQQQADSLGNDPNNVIVRRNPDGTYDILTAPITSSMTQCCPVE